MRMRKGFKVFASLLTAVALLAMLPGAGSLSVKAAEPTTYSVKYYGDPYYQWRGQRSSAWDDNAEHFDFKNYLVQYYLKDGDNIVVYPGENVMNNHLDCGGVKLGSLTIHNGNTVTVMTGGVKDCYILANNFCSINGNVDNAYIYDPTVAQFNNDVHDMSLYMPYTNTSTVACMGTVGRFRALDMYNNNTALETFYNIKAGSTIVNEGFFSLPKESYSTSADGFKENVTSSSTNKGSGEYDDVPKTGDSYLSLYLYVAALFSFFGYVFFKKKETR